MSYSQCDYSVVRYDSATGKGVIKTLPITLDFFETPMNGRILIAHLIRSGNLYYIEIEVTKDSSSQDLTPICLEDGSRLGFLLKNNETFSIPHVSEKICGIKTYDSKSGYTTVSNYGLFMLTQPIFEKLLKSEVFLLKIISKDYTKKFVLKDELEEFEDTKVKITNPSRFFIDNIDCMVNPKFD